MTSPLAAILLVLFAPPAASAPPQQRWPIEVLTVTGNSRYSAGAILAVAGLKKGDVVGKEDLEAARGRLMDSGAFSGVGYSYGPGPSRKGYRVEFEVIEAPYVYPFRFERLQLADAELTEALRRSDPLFAERIPATQPALNRYAGVIEKLLASKGFKEPVTARVAVEDSGELVVIFSPAAPPPSVAEVRFQGNAAIPATELQKVMAGVAIGVPFTERRFRELLEANVRPLYEALGRVRVSFPAVKTEPAQDVDGVAVTVQVAEGEVYTFGTVRVSAPAQLEKQLAAEAAALESGKTADFRVVDAAVEKIRRRLARRGYLKAEVDIRRDIHDAERRVDLTIEVKTGPQYTFGKLGIEGLDLTGQAEIRRLWALKPGSPFDAEYPEYFLQRVRDDGVFDNLGKTRYEVQVDEAGLRVDVTLYFR